MSLLGSPHVWVAWTSSSDGMHAGQCKHPNVCLFFVDNLQHSVQTMDTESPVVCVHAYKRP